MARRFHGLGILVVALMTNIGFTQYAPILWDTSGINLRQGYHTEWYRAGDNDPVGGNKVYTWSDCRSGDRDVYAQMVDVHGNEKWADGGKLICQAVARQEDPEVSYAGDGNWIFAWVDYRNTPEIIEAGDVYAQKVDSSGNALWDPAGIPVCVVDGIQISLRLVSDGSGGVIIVWEDNRNSDANNIYAQRITSDGQVAPGWAQDGIAVVDYVGRQEGITVDTDGYGGAIVAWKDTRQSGNTDIYAQRVRPNATLAWNQSGLPICTADFDQEYPKLCPDGTGGAYIVWGDKRVDNNFGDLYYQRVDSSGTMHYQTNGRILCDAAMEQQECRIMTADGGGAIFVWADFRDDPQNDLSDIYAQKINPAGNPLWGTNGLAICTAPNKQWGARFSTDGSGGTIIAWEDIRNGYDVNDADIYAQRISSSGSPLWTANGVVVCDEEGYQGSVLVKPDSSHGSFMIWQDMRDGSAGLYVQHLNANGVPLLSANGILVHHGIDGNSEDPTMVETIPGRVYVLWKDLRQGSGTLFYQLVDSAGNILLMENGNSLGGGGANGNMDQPHFVSDQVHGALVAWKDARSANLFSQIYVQRLNPDGLTLWTVGGIHVYPQDEEQSNPYIAPTGDGGAFVLWSGTSGLHIYVYCQKLDPQGNSIWTTPLRVSNGASEDICFGVVPDGEGGVVTTWVGGAWPDFRVYGQRLDSNGAGLWATDGVRLSLSEGEQERPTLISDGNSGAYFVWEEKSNFVDFDLLAQWVDRSGNYMWADSGLVICNASADQGSASMTLTNDGDVFFLWHDFRSGSQDVYLQKVAPSGDILCDYNGFGVCVGENDRQYPVMVHDNENGVYIAWEDYRAGTKDDIFGQHVDSTCAISSEWSWLQNGNIVNNELFWQLDPAIAPDGDGGAIVAWEDARSSGKEQTYNLFIQRMNDFSTSPVVEGADPVPLTFSLEQNYPNPFNPVTRIRYNLSRVGHVKLVIYDILGRQVRVLQNQMMDAGSHEVTWNGKTSSNIYASSGIYFYKLDVGNRSEVRKMVLLK